MSSWDASGPSRMREIMAVEGFDPMTIDTVSPSNSELVRMIDSMLRKGWPDNPPRFLAPEFRAVMAEELSKARRPQLRTLVGSQIRMKLLGLDPDQEDFDTTWMRDGDVLDAVTEPPDVANAFMLRITAGSSSEDLI